MKATLVAAAAAVLAGSASASGSHHRHDHQNLFGRHAAEQQKSNGSETCVPGCTTIWTTITGPAGLYTPSTTSTPAPVTTSVVPTTSAPVTVPTPIAQTCPTPGTYTFPATTVVLTETTTVCAASSTTCTSGTHTLGGVTTVVETATTIVCPYATTTTSSGVVTSVISTTTYVCPSSGTYTIAPVTTTVTESETVVVIPVVTTYCPGTYTAPAVVTTITETDVVVYCPFATPSTSSAPPPVATTSSAVAVVSSSAPAPKATASSHPSVGGSGPQWAIAYTPYTSTGGCKAASDVMDDMKSIHDSGFTSVRVYSTDCATLPNVGAGCRAYGLKMIIGIFIGEVGCANPTPDVSDQISAITQWAEWDLVELAVIGNEALFNGYCTVDELTQLIVNVKGDMGGAGYTGPYSTTDVVSAWQQDGVTSICEVIDVVCTNAYAYFNADTSPQDAGSFVSSQLEIVEGICNLPGYIMESGWPLAGDCNGIACPGQSEQATAIQSIQESCGEKVVFFSFSSDEWKAPGTCACEQSWGLSVFGF